MEFNKIAAALLVTVLAVMVISKIGEILVPTETVHTETSSVPQQTQQQQQQETEGPFTDYLAEASAETGQRIANACVSCHTLNEGGADGVGPHLYGVVGRQVGGVDGFNYSSNMADSTDEWTFQRLFEYLKNPQQTYSGSRMAFRLANPQQRASVILYLNTLSNNPRAIPEPTSPEDRQQEGEGEQQEGEAQQEEAQQQTEEQQTEEQQTQEQDAQGQEGQQQGEETPEGGQQQDGQQEEGGDQQQSGE